jgi:hypothetical protein
VPAAGVALAAVAVADRAVSERGDLLRGRADVVPALRRAVRVETGLGEQRAVVQQAIE